MENFGFSEWTIVVLIVVIGVLVSLLKSVDKDRNHFQNRYIVLHKLVRRFESQIPKLIHPDVFSAYPQLKAEFEEDKSLSGERILQLVKHQLLVDEQLKASQKPVAINLSEHLKDNFSGFLGNLLAEAEDRDNINSARAILKEVYVSYFSDLTDLECLAILSLHRCSGQACRAFFNQLKVVQSESTHQWNLKRTEFITETVRHLIVEAVKDGAFGVRPGKKLSEKYKELPQAMYDRNEGSNRDYMDAIPSGLHEKFMSLGWRNRPVKTLYGAYFHNRKRESADKHIEAYVNTLVYYNLIINELIRE